jgi:hypothetical protein
MVGSYEAKENNYIKVATFSDILVIVTGEKRLGFLNRHAQLAFGKTTFP